MRPFKYILDQQGLPVPEPNLYKWAHWLETAKRSGGHIAQQEWVDEHHVTLKWFSTSKMKSPNRNKFVRWLMPGCWQDADGLAHFDIPAIHEWLREQGLPVPDTQEEIHETREMLKAIIRRDIPDMQFIDRDSPED